MTGSGEYGNEPLVCVNCALFLGLADELLASEEELCSMYLFIYLLVYLERYREATLWAGQHRWFSGSLRVGWSGIRIPM